MVGRPFRSKGRLNIYFIQSAIPSYSRNVSFKVARVREKRSSIRVVLSDNIRALDNNNNPFIHLPF